MTTVACQHTVQDYLRAQRLHFRPKPGVRVLYWLLALTIALAFAQEIWIIARGGVLPRGWWILPAGFAYGAFLFFIFLPWRVGKIFQQNPNLAKPTRTELATTGFLLESTRGQIKLPWALIKSWKYNQHMLLIYHSKVHFYLFPRRCFSNEAAFNDFKHALAINVGPAAP